MLLARFVWNDGATARIDAAIRGAGGVLLSLNRGLDADVALACAYIDAKAAQADALRAALGAIVGNISLVELELIQEVAGASAGATATIHYVVETDVLPEADADCTAWYFAEHLPGLASVPGVVRAARYRNTGALDAGPRSHACYDLVTRDTFESPPWLKVRHTPWTARVVPSWRNTRRTMFGRTANSGLVRPQTNPAT